jgi:hypothetical protein
VVSSDSSTWYYQYRPELKEDKSGGMYVVEAKCGFVKFGTIGVHVIVKRLEDDLQRDIEKAKSTSIRLTDGTRRLEGELLRFRGIDRRNGFRPSDDESRETDRQEERLDKMYRSHEKKKKALLEGLAPREPIYVVSEWSNPDLDNIADLVNKSEQNDDISFKPDKRWQVPVNWKKLKLNITDKQVHAILGEPDKSESNGRRLVLSYGGVKGFGQIILTGRSDSSLCLDYWKEPFWDKELRTLTATSESDNEISG